MTTVGRTVCKQGVRSRVHRAVASDRGCSSPAAAPPEQVPASGNVRPVPPDSTSGRRGPLRPHGSLTEAIVVRSSGPTVVPVRILQIAPALHGAKMQTTEGTRPVVIWALVEKDDGTTDVIGLAVGGQGASALIPPDPGTFQSYDQTG